MSLDIFFDSVTGQRLQSPDNAIPATDILSGKLMSTQQVRVQYLRVAGQKGTPVAAPSNLIRFGMKAGSVERGHYADAAFDCYTEDFAAPPVPTLSGAFYTATLTIDGDALRALFPVAADGTSAGSADLIAEVRSGPLASATFPFRVANNLIKGPESPAVAVPGAGGYPEPAEVTINAAGVTKRTGAAGDSAALANVATVGRAPGTLFSFTEAATGQLVFFRLLPGAATAGNADQVAPADFNATTNPVHFALVPVLPANVVRIGEDGNLALDGAVMATRLEMYPYDLSGLVAVIDLGGFSNYRYAMEDDAVFSSVARAPGRSARVVLKAGNASRNLTFPADWVFVGAPRPATLAAGKRAVLALDCDGATDADVTATYLVQP